VENEVYIGVPNMIVLIARVIAIILAALLLLRFIG
jgi:hypothetical protein